MTILDWRVTKTAFYLAISSAVRFQLTWYRHRSTHLT